MLGGVGGRPGNRAPIPMPLLSPLLFVVTRWSSVGYGNRVHADHCTTDTSTTTGMLSISHLRRRGQMSSRPVANTENVVVISFMGRNVPSGGGRVFDTGIAGSSKIRNTTQPAANNSGHEERRVLAPHVLPFNCVGSYGFVLIL